MKFAMVTNVKMEHVTVVKIGTQNQTVQVNACVANKITNAIYVNTESVNQAY